MIMHQQSIDYNKPCSITFGSYVQAPTEPNLQNSQHPRTLDCIYLCYVDNDQGGHQLLDLHTAWMIKRHAVTIVPIKKTIIDLVHAMATNNKMPDGIKIEMNSGMTIYDSSWIAGVVYDNDDENTVNNSSYYSDSDNNSEESEEEENFDETELQEDVVNNEELLQEDVVNNEDNRPNNEEIEAENKENKENKKMRIKKKKLKKKLKKTL
jgi:hypothetical protein